MTEHIKYQNGIQVNRSVFTYNAANNLIAPQHTANKVYSSFSEIFYDGEQRKIRVEFDLKGAGQIIDKIEHYEYEATSTLPSKVSWDADADGQVDHHQEFTYQNDKPKTRHWYQNGQLIRLERYNYNAKGLLIEQASYSSETADFDSLSQYQYNSQGKLLSVTSYGDSSSAGTITYQALYNEHAKPLPIASFKPDGSIA